MYTPLTVKHERRKGLKERVRIVIPPLVVESEHERVEVSKGSESLDHWITKAVAVKYLLLRGYNRDEIFIEYSPYGKFRADVYGRKGNEEIWFEALGLNKEIEDIQKIYKGRLVRVVWAEDLLDVWKGRIDRNLDKRTRIRNFTKAGVEYWAVYVGREPEIVFGVRRDSKEEFTYFEGIWSLSNLQPRKGDRVVPYGQW